MNCLKVIPLLGIVASLAVGCRGGTVTALPTEEMTQPAATETATIEASEEPEPTGAAPAYADAATEEQNKAIVLRIYDEIYGQDQFDLAHELFSEDLIQHNPSVPAGIEGQIQLVQKLKENFPGIVATVKHISADGDLVAVHWHASVDPENEAKGQAVIDLYRLDNGKITEHWDKYQIIPGQTANSMFSDLYEYEGEMPTLSEDQEEANKELVIMAYTGLFNDRRLELLDLYWDPGYLQHNPRVANGTEALGQLVSRGGTSVDLSYTIADQDLVWTFMGKNKLAIIDIFRVADGKIVEHWDVMQ